ncbi:MAG: hypothetical protein WEC37_01345, partial [Anaerolineales bacterium]
LCYLEARSGFDYLWTMLNFWNGRYIRNRRLNCMAAQQSIHINAPAGLPVQADGDLIGVTPVEVRLEAAALKVAVQSSNL